MARKGPTPKNDEARQRRNRKPDSAGLSVIAGRSVPEPAERWSDETVAAWEVFWSSQVASSLVEWSAHVGPLRRYFDYLDERESLAVALRAKVLVEGSQGQAVLNPISRRLEHLERELRAIEDRFGLNVDSLLRAGVRFGEASKSLEGLVAEANERVRHDPRAAAVDVASAEA